MLKLSPPELKAMPDAHNLAVKELENMGPMTLPRKGFGICFRSLPYPVGKPEAGQSWAQHLSLCLLCLLCWSSKF